MLMSLLMLVLALLMLDPLLLSDLFLFLRDREMQDDLRILL